ncbi:hypothetical protein M9H77_25907 [Catharanthus roseus]|uniref:Uncharacterized protein n=1 Tax=Catharanthus roseus TaxID=4058 RepID=A0ACC0A8G4_CATRO|nr:hypothetical protein M9H77_25907 [Catharanthus roseus]
MTIISPPAAAAADMKKRSLVTEFKFYASSSRNWCAPFKPRSKMVMGSCYLPKEIEAKPLGEDAHFISDDEQTIGLADGVGSWAKKGIDAGQYARELMSNVLFGIKNQPKNGINPWKGLNEAFLYTESKGSSTACIITLSGAADFDCLHCVNVGDSGFLIIRDGKVVYESPRQQHRFNCPFQLGNSARSDTPDAAQVFVVSVEPGDIVVAGTDGVFDNLFPAEIEDLVEVCLRTRKNTPEAMASTIAHAARQVSLLKDSVSPFGKAAMDTGLCDSASIGGKYDDITAIVAHIV